MLACSHLSQRLQILIVDLLMMSSHLLLHDMIELWQILRQLEQLIALNISIVIVIDTADLAFLIGRTNTSSSLEVFETSLLFLTTVLLVNKQRLEVDLYRTCLGCHLLCLVEVLILRLQILLGSLNWLLLCFRLRLYIPIERII